MSDTVTILHKIDRNGQHVYRAHCNRCLKDLLGKRGNDTAVSKATVKAWAEDHLSKHAFRATWPERMVSYGYEIADTIELTEA